MNMKRITALLTIACAVTLSAYAKTPLKGITNTCEVRMPASSLCFGMTPEENDIFISQGYGQSEKNYGGYWDVYSDRDNNITYANSNSGTPFSTLDFKEKVRIAKIKKEYALVYTVPEDSKDVFPHISAGVEWKGWIPMSNLVYQSQAVVSPDKTPIKVLFRDNISFSGRNIDSQLFKSPTDQSKPTKLPESSQSFFYFIKSQGDMVLLSKGNDLTDGQDIYGWVNQSDIILWKSRIALEPTWDPSDVSFFTENNSECIVCKQGEESSSIGRIVFEAPSSSTYDIDQYRKVSGTWRFPLVAETGNRYDCGIPGNSVFLDAPTKRIFVSDEEDNSSDSQVNLFFVADGSKNYELYYPIIADLVYSLSERLSSIGQVRTGMMIYHDARNEQYVSDIFPLSSPDNQRLYDFIDQGGHYGFRDNLSESPLMKVLDQTIAEGGFSKDSKNYVIVIGGRGDDSDADLQELASKMSSLGVNLFSIQVQNNPNIAAYRQFSYSLKDLSRLTAYENDMSDMSIYSWTDGQSEVYSMEGNGANSLCQIRDGIMSESEFSHHLERIIDIINQTDSEGNAYEKSPQLFRYSSVPTDNYGRRYFKKVALYSEDEFDAILKFAEEFSDLYCTSNKDRGLFFTKIYKAYTTLGYPDSSDKLKEEGYLKVFASIEGISKPASDYAGTSLKNLLTDKAVSDAEYQNILYDIHRRYLRMRLVRESSSQYCTIINGEKYYWVPVEDLL